MPQKPHRHTRGAENVSTDTITRTAGKPKLPAGVAWEKYYADVPGGPPVRHEDARPVRLDDHAPVGRIWFCPAPEGCDVAEWVFSDLDPDARPTQRGCSEHVLELVPPITVSTARPGGAIARVRQGAVTKIAETRQSAADATAQKIRTIRVAAAEDARQAARGSREFLPGAIVGGAWLAGGAVTLATTEATEAYLAAAALAAVGTVLFYALAVLVQRIVARWRKRNLGGIRRIRARARWIALGPLLTALWIFAAQAVEARADNGWGGPAAFGGLLLIAAANGGAWESIRARRRAEAERIRLDAERRAAEEAEKARLAAWNSLLAGIAKAHEDAYADIQEEAWTAHGEWTEARIAADDSADAAGRKFAAEWARIITDETAPPWAVHTEVMPDRTRVIEIPDPEDRSVMKSLGHEFWLKAKPGVLSGPRPGDESPVRFAQNWIASMLGIDPNEITIIDKPEDDDGRQIPNQFIISLSRGVPLSTPVDYPGAAGCYVGADGGLYGFAGRDLLGKDVFKLYWMPGQPGGGARAGFTGSGKTIVAQVDLLNMLILGIFTMVHDWKNLIDYADFRGIIPLGCTKDHRDAFAAAKYEIMVRRQKWLSTIRTVNRNGISVAAEAVWKLEYGPPIAVLWDEFHLSAKDKDYIGVMSAMSRLQRISALMDWVITQGGGLADFSDSNFRDQVTAASIELMRMSQLQANLTNYPRDAYSPANLPRIPGMMVRQATGQVEIPYRSAYVHRKDRDGAIVDFLWVADPTAPGGARQQLFAPKLPDEDMAILEKYGVLDIWDLGTTEEGWQQLLADSEGPMGSIITGEQAGLLAPTGAGVDGLKPELSAQKVVAALLLANPNGMTMKQLGDSDWWDYTIGPWNDSPSGRPGSDRFSRVLRAPDAAERLKGVPVFFESDGGRPAVYRLLPAGREMAEQAQLLLARAGAPGLTTPEQRQAWEDVKTVAEEQMGMGEKEQAALAEAEEDMILRAEAAGAYDDHR
jgi:hypothetical protein